MKKLNLITILLLVIGLGQNMFNVIADDIEVEKPIINYNIKEINDVENQINFILDENTSFLENENKFNIKEIKDLNTNTVLNSLEYVVTKEDEYNFLVKYSDGKEEKTLDLNVKGINETQENDLSGNVDTKSSSEVSVSIEGADSFQTFTNRANGTSPGNYNFTINVNSTKELLSNASIEIPYGFLPASGDSVFQHFTMTEPIFSFDESQQSANNLINRYESLNDKLIIHLNDITSGVKSFNLDRKSVV